jgi:hypothetical protein
VPVPLECFEAVRCTFVAELDVGSCANDAVADAVRTPFEKAEALVQKADDAAQDQPKTKKKRLRRAIGRLQDSAKAVRQQKKKGRLSDACAEELATRLRDAEERAERLIEQVAGCSTAG